MKFEEAMELKKDAIEAANEEARDNIERVRIEEEMARRSAEYAAKQEREEKEKRDREDAQLIQMVDRSKRERLRAKRNDPDVYVRIIGNQQQAVRVNIAPIKKKNRPFVTVDFLAGMLVSLVVMSGAMAIVFKVLGVL